MARVAIVTTSYPSYEGDPSGHFVEAHARELARDHDVTVLAFGSAAVGDSADASPRADELEVRWLGGARLFSWPGVVARLDQAPWRVALAIAPTLRATLEAARFDHVVAHWIVPSAVPVAEIVAPRHLEVWAHGADVRLLAKRPRLAAFVVARLLRRGARFVFVAQPLLDTLASRLDAPLASRLRASSSVRPAPIRVPARSSLSDPRSPIDRSVPYAVWIGRAVATKRPDLAVSAARRAAVRLVVIGDGPALPSTEPNVRVLGRLARHEALRWIAHADVLVSTSCVEGTSTVIREARALNVPVVAFPAGDVEALATRDAGVHVVRTEEELASWLARAPAPRVNP